MSWGSPEDGKQFRVCVFVVDDTYWDDGNRTTSRDYDFASLGEAVAFQQKARKARWYETTSWVTNRKLRRYLDADSFLLYRWLADKTPRPGWEMIKHADIVTLLGEVAGD